LEHRGDAVAAIEVEIGIAGVDMVEDFTTLPHPRGWQSA
jgi:hypothetical protein